MERIPDTSHTLVQTLDGPRDPLQLLAARVAQQRRLLQNLVRLHVAHTDGLLLAVDVAAAQHGVPAGSGGYGHFDLGVGAREGFEVGFEEGADGEGFVRSSESLHVSEGSDLLHSSAAASPVAIMEVQALALENEGADAVLGKLSEHVVKCRSNDSHLWLCH